MSLSPGGVLKGRSVLLSFSVASVAGQQPTGLQWKFSYPSADLGFVAAGQGPSALAAGKTITCNGVNGSYTCIAAGMNRNLIPNGVLTSLLFSVPSTTLNLAPVISVSGAMAVGPTATAITSAATGSTVTVTTQPPNVSTLAVATPSLPPAQVNVSYSQTLAASSGTAPYSWSLLSGTLPPGLTVSSAGVISGKPTTAGTFTFAIQVTDATKLARSQGFLIEVASTPVNVLPQVVNGASFQPMISPGSWFSIIGTNLASITRAMAPEDMVGSMLPTSLGGFGVTVNGQASPVSYVSPTQINALMSSAAIPGPAEIRVTGGSNSVPPMQMVVSPLSPGLFMWTASYVAASHLDSSLAVKPGVVSGTTTVPAKPGEVIVLLGNGFGPTVPAAPPGQVVPLNSVYALKTLPTVTIGGIAAPVTSAKLAAGQAGVVQITVTVPASAPNGDLPVVAAVGGVASQSGAFLTVQK
ncbi:MAG: hypothetical protein HYX25_02850 [Candidatus Solibacter usitatus]|nr:hypothetical protein [Candidatus Solibacter usitatus]